MHLDHLIGRESIQHQVEGWDEGERSQHSEYLPLHDLRSDGYIRYLRKPNFLPPTNNWSPQDCVELLESLLQVEPIPSLIMWRNPKDGLLFILKGAHRLSCAMAWVTDDWGDKLPGEHYASAAEREPALAAAAEVRKLVGERIGQAEDYIAAAREFAAALNREGNPRLLLPELTYKRGYLWRRTVGGNIGFHTLWARGDYHDVEQLIPKIRDWRR